MRPAVAATAGLLLPVGAYLAFRIFYYGDTVPNPAHVKVEGLPLAFQLSSAGYYLRNSLPLWLPGAMGSLCALALASGKSVRLDPAHASAGPLSNRAVPNGWFVAALTLPILTSTAVGGGDHMPGARFLVPVVVLLAFATAVAGPPAAGRRRTLALVALAAATVAQAGILLTMPVKYDRAAAEGEPIGRFLEKTLSPGSLVSTATAGSEAFFAPSLRFLDPLGLNDRHIARRRITEFVTRWQVMPGHAKGDGPYVLSRRPDVVILGRARGFLGTDPLDWFLTDFELLSSDEFRLLYRPYRFAVPLRPLDAARLGVAQDRTRPPALELTAYLRSESPAASALAREGEPLTPPWLAGPRP